VAAQSGADNINLPCRATRVHNHFSIGLLYHVLIEYNNIFMLDRISSNGIEPTNVITGTRIVSKWQSA
jgi:hypothetical protein